MNAVINSPQLKNLKFRFHRDYAAIQYPMDTTLNNFITVNTSRSKSFGTHWVVLAKRDAYPIFFFADPVALLITTYKQILSRLKTWK